MNIQQLVLIVDDDSNILRALRRLIKNAMPDVKVCLAQNGKEALELLSTENFTMIVSDLRMPDLDGQALLNTVRRIKPSMIRILLSGQTDTDKLLSCLPITHQYIEKPCNNSDIISLVNLISSVGKSELPPVLLKHALSFTTFAVDGGVYSLISHVINKKFDQNIADKIGKLLFCDLGIYLATNRLQKIAGDLNISLIKELVSSPCLIPIQVGTESARRLRVLSIRFVALAKKLSEDLALSVSDALKIAAHEYSGEYILELQLGGSPLNNQIINGFSYKITNVMHQVWGDNSLEIEEHKIYQIKLEIDQLYSFNGELGLVDDDAMISLLGDITSGINFKMDIR